MVAVLLVANLPLFHTAGILKGTLKEGGLHNVDFVVIPAEHLFRSSLSSCGRGGRGMGSDLCEAATGVAKEQQLEVGLMS